MADLRLRRTLPSKTLLRCSKISFKFGPFTLNVTFVCQTEDESLTSDLNLVVYLLVRPRTFRKGRLDCREMEKGKIGGSPVQQNKNNNKTSIFGGLFGRGAAVSQNS